MLLARMFGRLRDERVVDPLLAALRRVELATRREFIRALAMVRGQKALAELLEIALSDDDATCRVLALCGLGGERSQIDGGRVLARIRSRGFTTLGEEEKDLLFRALGATASDDSVPVLAKMLRAGRILRGRDPRNDARVVSALKSIASEAAVEALRRCSRSWRGSIRRLCSEALEGMAR